MCEKNVTRRKSMIFFFYCDFEYYDTFIIVLCIVLSDYDSYTCSLSLIYRCEYILIKFIF